MLFDGAASRQLREKNSFTMPPAASDEKKTVFQCRQLPAMRKKQFDDIASIEPYQENISMKNMIVSNSKKISHYERNKEINIDTFAQR
jgi:hypothetical protein